MDIDSKLKVYSFRVVSFFVQKWTIKALRIRQRWKFFFRKFIKCKDSKIQKKNYPQDQKFKVCFNIGSNWGPRLPVGRGEHADSVPSLGNGVRSLSLINCPESKKRENIKSLKTFTKLLTYLKFSYSLFQIFPSHSKIE